MGIWATRLNSARFANVLCLLPPIRIAPIRIAVGQDSEERNGQSHSVPFAVETDLLPNMRSFIRGESVPVYGAPIIETDGTIASFSA